MTGNDDITALTRTVNGMLDRLESAFVGQRQFLDDAGHELKTPLTVLRGHLELLDVGSPEEVAETRELLLDEVDRMSRLVGDLILLAKSDRPDFVSPRPVDLRDSPSTCSPRPAASATGSGRSTRPPSVTASPTSSASPRRCSSSPTTRSSTPRPATWWRSARRTTAASARLWVRDTGPGVPPRTS